MNERLQAAFDQGKLYRPNNDQPNFVDLVNALAKLTGVTPPNPSAHVDQIAQAIGPSEHLVFVLVDGMGDLLLESLPEDAFLHQHRQQALRSVFPSTTACATCTIATGLWPGQHGVPGWWAWLEEYDLPVTTLPFTHRFTGQPLDQGGLTASAIWREMPLMVDMSHEPMCYHPHEYSESIFTRYLRGYRSGMGHGGPTDAIDRAIERVLSVEEASYTFIYLPEYDTICHELGHTHARAKAFLRLINREIKRLHDAVGHKARLVVSADHGQILTPPDRRFALRDGDPLYDYLETPPAGEPRTPTFYVKPDQHEAFVEAFEARYAEHFALLPMTEASELGMFGPHLLTKFAHQRFGDFIAIAYDNATLRHYPANASPLNDHLGQHAGLTHRETTIPLIIA